MGRADDDRAGSAAGAGGFSGADLAGQDFSGSNLAGRDFSDANLAGADLSGANLRGTDFSGADLSGADVRGANLAGADLSGADLTDVTVSGSNLANADLTDAELSGADLRGANLGAGPGSADDSLASTVNSVVSALTLLLGLGLLAAGRSWFWVVFVVGFAGVLPLASHLAGRYEARFEDSGAESDADGERAAALDALRERYASGDIDEAAFEPRVERLLETESVSDAKEFYRSADDAETDADADIDSSADRSADDDRASEPDLN